MVDKWKKWYRQQIKTARCKRCGRKLKAPESIKKETCIVCRDEENKKEE